MTNVSNTWNDSGSGVVSAVFDSDDEARGAIAALRAEGIDDALLSLITQHRGKATANVDGNVVDEEHSNLLRGILGGGALGAGLTVAALAWAPGGSRRECRISCSGGARDRRCRRCRSWFRERSSEETRR